MTQISLKLFNKPPLVRNDSGSLCRAGASRKAMPRGQVVLSQAMYMYAGISDDLSKAFPIAQGRVRQHRCSSFLADHDRVVGARCQS